MYFPIATLLTLIEKDPEEFCRAVLAHYGWNAGEPLVIDGIRRVEVARALCKLVAPLEVRVIFLDVDERQSWSAYGSLTKLSPRTS
jgi:hypothetical protein